MQGQWLDGVRARSLLTGRDLLVGGVQALQLRFGLLVDVFNDLRFAFAHGPVQKAHADYDACHQANSSHGECQVGGFRHTDVVEGWLHTSSGAVPTFEGDLDQRAEFLVDVEQRRQDQHRE